MNNEYFLVEQKISDDFPAHQRFSLVKINEKRELDYISGNSRIIDLLEIKEGNVVISERAVCEYEVHGLEENAASLWDSTLQKSLWLSIKKKRPHSFRRLH